MKFHPFVLPFTVGLAFVLVYVVSKWAIWIFNLPKEDKKTILRNIFSPKTLWGILEVFLESLVHRKIFKKNFLLGYMHMSLALGWLLLILVGNLETRVYTTATINPPYFPIFFQFFNHDIAEAYLYKKYFSLILDALLLFILSGVAIIFFKRAMSGIVGMKRTTNHTVFNRIAMTTLWLIFPLRLMAESVTAAIHSKGNFLTGTIGDLIVDALPLERLFHPLWWAYSIALGLFFFSLPFSRFMHIPTEILLIFLRRWGVKEGKEHNSYTRVEINSCSRCGVCIDACQLSSSLNINDTQAAYFLSSLRYDQPSSKLTETCMMCMRCLAACPVGIEITAIRGNHRALNQVYQTSTYPSLASPEVKPSKVAFFAGCMGHLTPSVIKSTLELFRLAGIDYCFIDKDGSACCGKPLQLTGEAEAASKLVKANKEVIARSGAEVLVTPCPICARIFTVDYELNIPVLHHSQFLIQLTNQGKLKFNESTTSIAYHDPCELGRGLGVYNEPRDLLSKSYKIVSNKHSKEEALCCGGALGISNISMQQREVIARDTLDEITNSKTHFVATACPLCKKTFQHASEKHQVKDIAELMLSAICKEGKGKVARDMPVAEPETI